MNNKFSKIFLLLAIFLTLPNFANAEVIFETNFDSMTTWNPTGSTTYCVPWDLASCTSGNAPMPFTEYRVQAPYCSLHYAPHIGNASDIQASGGFSDFSAYGESGKSYVHFYEPCDTSAGSGWGSDGLLGVSLASATGGWLELWVQANVRFEPGFQFMEGAMQKIMHIMHSDMNNISMFDASNNPDAVPQIYVNGQYWFGPPNYLPVAQFNQVQYPLGSGNNGISTLGPVPSSNVVGNDGSWHKVKYHVKLNSAANVADGIFELWVDDVLMSTNSAYNVGWTTSNTPSASAYGWNRVIIGGNSYNAWLSANMHPACQATMSCPNQWYALDNLIVSTTSIPDNYVIGGIDETAPNAPSGLSVL